MLYRVIGDAAMLVHFGFLVFLTVGGFLAWRWRRLIWAHLAVAGWGVVNVVWGPPCPLTSAENWARSHYGEAPLKGTGFIDNYLEGVVYPERYTGLLQALVGTAVLVSWVGFVRRRRPGAAVGPGSRRPGGSAAPREPAAR